MLTELRYAVRGLLKTPGFTLVAVGVLALAVAVNTAIFGLVNALFLQPLHVRSPETLTFAYVVDPAIPKLADGVSFEVFEALRRRTDVFADGALKASDTARIAFDGVERRLSGESVTGNYFSVLGVGAAAGRTLLASDDDGTADPVVVISERLWRTTLHADPSVIGRTVSLIDDGLFDGFYRDAGTAYTIVGVIAEPFRGLGTPMTPTDYWAPTNKRLQDGLAAAPPGDERARERAFSRYGRPVLRRRAGVSALEAARVVEAVGYERTTALSRQSKTVRLVARDSLRTSLPYQFVGFVTPERLAVAALGVAGLVLLIAIANMIGLFTARGLAERNEVSIRVALGASKWSLARGFVTQGMVLAVLGGGAGLLLAIGATRVFAATAPTTLQRGQGYTNATFDVPIDWRVAAFATVVAIITALAIAWARSRQAWRVDVRGAMQADNQTTSGARTRRLRYGVVVPQIAAALAILLVAGAFMRALLAAEAGDPGYDASQVTLVSFDLPEPPRNQLKEVTTMRREIEARLIERASGIGGVTSVSVADSFRVAPLNSSKAFVLAREDVQNPSAMKWTSMVAASAGYFDALKMRLVRGRTFDRGDDRNPSVAIVSVQAAAVLWPGQDPIGQRFTKTWPNTNYTPEWVEVVGVVNDVREPATGERWNPTIYMSQPKGSATMVVRGSGKPEDLIRELTAALAAIEPRARVSTARTLTSAIADVRYPTRLASAVLVSTGAVGLLLAAVGLFGVVSYSVAQRRREMGVRRALGAERRDIIGLVVREGMTTAVIGSTAGLLLGYWAIQLAQMFAMPIPPTGWLVVAAVPLLVGGVVLIACLVPARRAAAVDPIVALRSL